MVPALPAVYIAARDLAPPRLATLRIQRARCHLVCTYVRALSLPNATPLSLFALPFRPVRFSARPLLRFILIAHRACFPCRRQAGATNHRAPAVPRHRVFFESANSLHAILRALRGLRGMCTAVPMHCAWFHAFRRRRSTRFSRSKDASHARTRARSCETSSSCNDCRMSGDYAERGRL